MPPAGTKSLSGPNRAQQACPEQTESLWSNCLDYSMRNLIAHRYVS